MNKGVKAFIIVCGVIIGLWFIARTTGMLQFYKIPTPSSEPAIHVDQKIFTTNLLTPGRGDIIAYTSASMDSAIGSYMEVSRGSQYVSRLCAVSNDVIQMKDGVVYVNGKNFDADKNLYHYYIVPSDKMQYIPITEKDQEIGNVIRRDESVNIINITDETIKKLPPTVSLVKYIDTNSNPEDAGAAFYWYDKSLKWTVENFGPLTVPAGKGFIMGDNRGNSLDSRYIGFIALKDIKGVKL